MVLTYPFFLKQIGYKVCFKFGTKFLSLYDLKKEYYIGFVVAVNKKENLCTYYREPTDLRSDKNWTLKSPTNFHPLLVTDGEDRGFSWEGQT